ncbi:MAG: MFS transporter [Solirubrobacterales bacterium]
MAAMVFAVGMTFIDMTIVSIAIPDIQQDLKLSETGIQWMINAYLLALSATFALGGRLGDTLGKVRMVVLGVVMFATASALCGLTPTGSFDEAWIIVFRAVQGIGAALMLPAALALIISAYPIDKRGKALAIFFAITGGLTSIGPIAGGYLTEVDWRAIFWVNIPIAIIALVLIRVANPRDERNPQPIDYRGAVLVTGGMALSVLGLQQASDWGWGSWQTIGSIVAGTLLLIAFFAHELRTEDPLIRVRIFTDRSFAADNVVLLLLSAVFIPLFFFSSTYAQLSLEQSAANAGLYLLIFFGGFAVASQLGGRILDQQGARPAIVLGSALGAVGFYLWAGSMTDLNISAQWPYIVMAGAGIGLILGPANTDAINRAPASTYGEATGITQTIRNYGASIGLAIMGTILITQNRINLEETLGKVGIGKGQADAIAAEVAGGGSSARSGGSGGAEVFKAIQDAYAQSTQTVFYIMAGILAAIFIFSIIFVPRGKVEAPVAEDKFDNPDEADSVPAGGNSAPA